MLALPVRCAVSPALLWVQTIFSALLSSIQLPKTLKLSLILLFTISFNSETINNKAIHVAALWLADGTCLRSVSEGTQFSALEPPETASLRLRRLSDELVSLSVPNLNLVLPRLRTAAANITRSPSISQLRAQGAGRGLNAFPACLGAEKAAERESRRWAEGVKEWSWRQEADRKLCFVLTWTDVLFFSGDTPALK